MRVANHSLFGFAGPYFSSTPRLLGEEAWRRELRGGPNNHCNALLAGGWYAVGRGCKQTAKSVKMLKQAEVPLRELCDLPEYAFDLGVNLAAQGIGLMRFGMNDAAALRLNESLAILDKIGYPHRCDMAEIAVYLATAEGLVHGPSVGLRSLMGQQHHLFTSNLSAQLRAIELRIRLQKQLHAQGPRHAYNAYVSRGYQIQMDDPEFTFYLSTLVGTLGLLLRSSQVHRAQSLAMMVLRELVNNRNLELSTIDTALSLLSPALERLEDLRVSSPTNHAQMLASSNDESKPRVTH